MFPVEEKYKRHTGSTRSTRSSDGSLDGVTAMDRLSALQQTVFVPLFTLTCLPSGTAEVAELIATATPSNHSCQSHDAEVCNGRLLHRLSGIIASSLSGVPGFNSRHMVTAFSKFDHSPAILASLPAMFTSQLKSQLQSLVIRTVTCVRCTLTGDAGLRLAIWA